MNSTSYLMHEKLTNHGWQSKDFDYSHEFLSYPPNLDMDEAQKEHESLISYLQKAEDITIQ